MNKYIKNEYWENASPLFTIGTPVYNRSHTLHRTLESIENQTRKDYELIIVDDGSLDDVDSIVLPFLKTTHIPTLYIKKENGGVHTARNTITREARGFFLVTIDSDDELTPTALEIFKNTWDSIPESERKNYREVVGECMDEKGNRCGLPFPEDINKLPFKEAETECIKTNGEHFSASVTSIMKENLFPEPEGITFYTETILWGELEKKYKSYFINDIVRVYHQEGDDHLNTTLNKTNGKSIQQCKNGLWECFYVLSNYETYRNYFSYQKTIIRYSLMRRLLKMRGDDFYKKYKLKGIKEKVFSLFLSLPIFFYSFIYRKKE